MSVKFIPGNENLNQLHMATVNLVMPKMGESIMEATILKWHKQPGDHVNMDETVLEIATDKVDTEVPSTTEGVVEEILYHVNDVVPVGAVIAKIRTNVQEPVNANTSREHHVPEHETASQAASSTHSNLQADHIFETRGQRESAPQNSNNNGRFYSPLVLNIAASEGVSMSELEGIPGTGNEGRVTKKDILQYVGQRKTKGWKADRTQRGISIIEDTPQVSHESQLTTYTGNVEIIEMDR